MVFFVYIVIFTCIQCNFIYVLNIRVLVNCTSCLDNFDPLSAWSSNKIKLKFKNDPVWLDRL